MTKEQKAKELISKIKFEGSYSDWIRWIGDEMEEYAAIKMQPLVDALDKIVYTVKHLQEEAKAVGGQLDGIVAFQIADDPKYLKKIAVDALASYAGSAEVEEERPCNPTPDSDTLMEPPSFEQMVDLIKKNFRDVLELSGIKDEGRIAKAWERYKCLNHLYRDGEPEKKDPWISVKDPPKVTGIYLCYCEKVTDLAITSFQRVCQYNAKENRWNDNMYLVKVLYWTELLPPPAATNQEGGENE